MHTILSKKFFNRETQVVARELLGKFLVRKIGRREIALMITEVEVYDGFGDKASHASRGKTARNSIMFGPAGYWYVYFTCGMHWILNVVTREKDYPAAVLIRGVDGFNGPAKLTKFLKIDKKLDGLPARKENGLWIEDRGYKKIGDRIYPPTLPTSPRLRLARKLRRAIRKNLRIEKGSRVGVNYSGPYWAKRKWRFWI